MDHYIAEHRRGEAVSGRLIEVQGDKARVELGEGVVGTCDLKPNEPKPAAEVPRPADVSSLSAMLAAKWKQGGPKDAMPEPMRTGQIRSFRIRTLDADKRLIELELAT